MTGAHLRYPVSPQHPPLRVFVNVQWRGRLFVAQRDTHPKTRRPCWLTTKKGSGESWYLPPRGDDQREKHAWGPNPDYWWPLKPEAWRAPLPPPLTAVIDPAPRYVDIRARRRRHEPRPIDASESREIKTPWWWQGDLISYEPPGTVSREMAEGRVMRALAVHGAGDGVVFPARHEPLWAQFSDIEEAMKEAEREASVAAASEAVLRPKLVLGPDDHRDWLTAMGWFAVLTPRRGRWLIGPDGCPTAAIYPHPAITDMLGHKQKILIWRAQERWLSFRRIAELLDEPRATVHDWYQEVIDDIHAAANGRLAVVDHIAALRVRNREHKRQGDRL